MIARLRHAMLLGLFVAAVACDDGARPTAPSPNPAPPQAPAVPSPPVPPLTGAATTYVFSEPLDNFSVVGVRPYTEGSSFVLYESGGFYLAYKAFAHQYRGGYEQEDGRITFYFSGDARSSAIGTVKGDRLEIRYNDIMQHSDFENAVYRRVP
jgi:hypothetical protein